MTQKQRLKYSILISLVVLGTMFGLSYLQNTGVISEKNVPVHRHCRGGHRGGDQWRDAS